MNVSADMSNMEKIAAYQYMQDVVSTRLQMELYKREKALQLIRNMKLKRQTNER